MSRIPIFGRQHLRPCLKMHTIVSVCITYVGLLWLNGTSYGVGDSTVGQDDDEEMSAASTVSLSAAV